MFLNFQSSRYCLAYIFPNINFKCFLCFLAFGQEKLSLTRDSSWMHTLFPFCTRPLHFKKAHPASSGLLNERLWEVVAAVATGKAVLHSCQSGLCNSHYRGEQRKCFRLMFWKVLSRLCFERRRRRRMMMMMAGYVWFQKYLTSAICWAMPMWMLYKGEKML